MARWAGDIPWSTIYHVAIEQYTKGINQLIPHAVWYDDSKVGGYAPELSWRSPLYAAELPKFNRFLSRLNLMLQNDGRIVADIAVLYPIATLQGGHRLDGELGHYKGGVTIPEADYVDVGECLATRIGRDFVFLHPETLDERCRLDGDANLGAETVTTQVRLRGRLTPELLNPHNGQISAAVFTRETTGNQDITTVQLTLDPISSVFVVSTEETR